MIDIKTSSIKMFLEVVLNKKFNLISIDELSQIDTIAIEGNGEIIDFKDLACLPNLKKIVVNRIKVTSENLNNIKDFSNAKEISFNRCMFENENDISLLEKMDNLDFNNCYIEDYTFLQRLSNIKSLSIANPNSDAIIDLSLIKNYSLLEKLVLDKCQISNFESLINNKKINYLSVLWTPLSNNCCDVINELPELQTLFISQEYSFSNAINKNVIVYNDLSQFTMEESLDSTVGQVKSS